MFMGVGRVGRQMPSGAGSLPSLDMNLLSGALDPRITFARASVATAFDATGTLQTFSANTPRFDYGPTPGTTPLGLLIEEPRTNSITNNTMVGASAGTPGTVPTGWNVNPLGAVSSIIGTGVENGIAYIDIRINGTTTGANPSIAFEAITTIAAVQNQVWANSFYYKLVGGSLANVTGIRAMCFAYTSGAAFINSFFGSTVTPTGAALATQRATEVSTLVDATTAFVRPFVQLLIASGATVDFTLRIGLPQLELGLFPTSVMATSGAAVNRAAESCTMPAASWFNAAVGSLSFEGTSDVFSSPNNYDIVGFNTGAFTDAIFMRIPAGSTTVSALSFTANTNRGGPASGAGLTANTIFKSAMTYNTAGLSMSVALNGSAPVAASPTAMPSGLTQLVFGPAHILPGVSGYYRRIRYWPRVLSNGELQSVTT